MLRFRRWLYRSAVIRSTVRKSRLDLVRLEDRVVPALASPPVELFSTTATPKSVAVPDLNADGRPDLAAILPDGKLVTSLNLGNDTWGPVATSDLGVTDVTGFSFAHLGVDPFPDLVAQTPDGVMVARGDGAGRFVHAIAVPLGVSGSFAEGSARIDPATGYLAGDTRADLVVLAPGTNEVLILKGNGAGGFETPVRFGSGGTTPVAAVMAQLVGDSAPDLAVGHQDGTVTIFRGNADGSFTPLPGATVTGLGVVTDLTAADVDGDGELDLIVSGTDRVTVLKNRPDPAPQTVLVNGDFSQGLSGWTVEGGSVLASGFAQFREVSTSLLSTLKQSFVVPTGPATLSFDVTALSLESPLGVPPDAFEVSILDEAGNPLVPSFRADASSFLNLGPDGHVNLAPGVQFDGRHATVDISGPVPGTVATIYFDLIGNKPGLTSTASIDNVSVNPATRYDDTFEPILLSGPFFGATGIAAGDVDGDGFTDVVVAEGGSVVVFAGDGTGGFTRSEYALAPDTQANAIVVGNLTSGDSIGDVLDGVAGGVRSPLVFGGGVLDSAPRILPVAGIVGNEGSAVTLTGSFTDSDGGGPYTATIDWGDGTTSDADVSFSSGAGTITATHIYADNGSYPVRVIVRSASGAADFADTTSTIANVDPLVAVTDLVVDSRYGPEVAVATFSDPGFSLADYRTRETFLARIDWGDGSPAPFGRIELTNGGPGTPTTATVYGRPNYATPGVYTATVTVTDDDGGTHTASFTVVARAAIGDSGIWWVPGNEGDTVRVRFDLLQTATTLENELGYFVADNARGTVAGVDPSDPAYLGKVLYFTQRGVLFAQGSDPGAAAWVDLPAGTFVGFYLVQNASTSDLLNVPAPLISNPDVSVWLSPAAANADGGTNHYLRTDLDGGWIQYGAEDGAFGGDFDFDDLVFRAGPAATDPPVVGEFTLPATSEGSPISLAVPIYTQDPTGALSTHINWGDGTTSSGSVALVNGVRTVQGSHTYADNGTYSVVVTVTDAGGLSDTGSASVSVENVAPTLTPAPDRTARPGEVINLTVGSFSDPGFSFPVAGTTESFTTSIDWGDGSSVEPGTLTVVNGSVGVLTTGTVSGSHVYSLPGLYTVVVQVVDDDGGSDTRTFTILVAATAPVVTSAPNLSGTEGASLAVSAPFTDPDPVDSFSATITWGDGSTSAGSVSFANGVGVVSGSHPYPDNNAWPISLTITDQYGLSVTRSLTANVTNVTPLATPALAQTSQAGSVLSLTAATFSDPGFTSTLAGTQETFTATIDWGDGSAVEAGLVSVVNGAAGKDTTGSVAGSHIYSAAGTYIVSITVADDDGGSSTVTFPVTVSASGASLGCFPSAAPVITGISRATSIASGAASTSDTSVVLYGTGQAGATLSILRDGVVVGTVVVGGDGNWRFDSTGTTLSAGSYAFTVEQAGFGPLGVAAPYNVFVLGDASGTPDARGRYAAGGNVSLTNFSVGQDLPSSAGTRDNLVAGGSLTTTGGQVYNGNATYGSTRSVSSNTTLNQGAVRKESVIDFAAAGTWLVGRADAWAALPPTGTTTYTPTDSRWAINLSTSATGLVVFAVDGAKLSAASSFTISAPAGTTVLINVSGTSGTLQNFGFFLNNGVDRNHILFNFANYTSLTVNAVGITGSVFAPRAAVTFNNGNVDGQLVAASLSGSGVFRNYPFAGECPSQTSSTFAVTVSSPTSEAAPKLFVVGTGQASRYTASGTLLGTSDVPGPVGTPTGVTANAAGTWTWVVTAATDGTTWVTASDADGSERGRWRAWGMTDARDIATNGTDIWIVGRDVSTSTFKIFRFEKGAMVRSGGLEPAGSFGLHSSNTNPTGLATDGWNVFVTDDGTVGRMFAYDINGNPLGGSNGWQLDTRNVDPSGVALNPGGGSELWVVDKTTRQVFTYSNGRNNHWWNSGGAQVASSVFDLAAGSPAPEGIADPDPTPIVFGDLVSGDLTGSGDAAVFTFTTTAGTTIFLDAATVNYGVNWHLSDPDGQTVLAYVQTDRVVTAPSTGAYLFTVTSATGDPVSYSFRVVEVIDPAPVAIAFGDLVSDSLAAGGETRRYTLTGTAGQEIFFDRHDTGTNTQAWLTGPNGEELFYHSLDDVGDIILPANGEYQLLLRNPTGETGSFEFVLYAVPPAIPVSISLGNSVSDSISVPGSRASYSFVASAGTWVYFQPISSITPEDRWKLTGPDTSIVFDRYLIDSEDGPSSITIRLSMNGTYTLSVDAAGDSTGAFEFQTADVSPTLVNITTDQDIADELTPSQPVTAYTFDLASPAAIFFEPMESDGYLQWILGGPDDFQVEGSWYSSWYTGPYDLLPEGTYTLTVWSGDSAPSASLPFSFRVWNITSPTPTPISIGDEVSGQFVEPGLSRGYSFAGLGGQAIALDLLDGFGNVEVRLLNSAGQELFWHEISNVYSGIGLDRGPFILPANGTYTLIVSSPDFGGEGGSGPSGYQFLVVDAPLVPALPISLGTPVSGSISQLFEVAVYTIVVNGGDQIQIEPMPADSSLRWTLVGPGGEILAQDDLFYPTTIDAVSAGTHTLYLAHVSDGTAAFEFQVNIISVPPVPLNLDELTTGTTPAGVGGGFRYTFTAAPGQRIFLDTPNLYYPFPDSRLTASLTAADGSVVFISSAFNDVDTTVLVGGEYTLRIANSSSNAVPTIFSFTLWDVPPPADTPIELDQLVESAIGVPGELDSYLFSAEAGQRIYIPTPNGMVIKVYAPDGNLTAVQYPYGSGQVLPETGLYRLTVEPANNPDPFYARYDQTGPYSFTVWKLDPAVAVPVEIGETALLSVTKPGQEVAISFLEMAGNRVILDPGPSYTRLIRPDGSVLVFGQSLQFEPVTLDQTGTWTLVAAGSPVSPTRLRVTEVPPDETLAGVLNVDLLGSAAGGQRIGYTFDLTANEAVLFDVIENGDYTTYGGYPNVGFTLLDPTGQPTIILNATNDVGPFIPTVSGTYTLVAKGLYNSDAEWIGGNFRFRMQEVPTPVSSPADTVGNEFWLAVPNQHVYYSLLGGNIDGAAEPILYVSSDTATTGIVSLPALGWSSSFSVAAGESTAIAIPSFAEIGTGERIGAALHLLSFDPVSVTGLTYSPYAADGYLAIPADAVGTEYVILTAGVSGGSFSADLSPSFQVVATADGTTVTITPSIDLPGHPVGVPFDVVLNLGQVYSLGAFQFTANADPTGTLVSADKPVAVYGSHPFTVLGSADAANHLVEMLPSVAAWGREYPVVPPPTARADPWSGWWRRPTGQRFASTGPW